MKLQHILVYGLKSGHYENLVKSIRSSSENKGSKHALEDTEQLKHAGWPHGRGVSTRWERISLPDIGRPLQVSLNSSLFRFQTTCLCRMCRFCDRQTQAGNTKSSGSFGG